MVERGATEQYVDSPSMPFTILFCALAALIMWLLIGLETSPYISLDGGVATQVATSSEAAPSISYTSLHYTVLSWDGYIFEHYVLGHQNIAQASTYGADNSSVGLNDMRQAKANAAAVSLALVKGGSSVKSTGLEIIGTTKPYGYSYGLDIHGLAVPLIPGMVISSVNGTHVTSTRAFNQMLSEGGQYIKLTVKGTSPRPLSINVPTSQISGSEGLGLVLANVWKANEKVPSIATGDGEGPSAGLMFTLADIEMLTHHKLTNTKIAGTGTIDGTGAVGPVGAVPYKVAAAVAAGDKVFFVPASQWFIARLAAHGHLTVVPVYTASDALQWLCMHGSSHEACALSDVAYQRLA